jgi:CMP-N-acetylneuraminic acid synthetase
MALIAAKGNSQRVPGKNTREFHNGKSLLDIKIEQLKRIEEIDAIVVSSNDEGILNTARKNGCLTQHRPEYFCKDDVKINHVYSYMAYEMPEQCDTIVFANVTNPLVSDETIKACIEKHKGFNHNVTTTTWLREFLFYEYRPVNFDIKIQPRSQDLPNSYQTLNFAISVIGKKEMCMSSSVLGKYPVLFPISDIEAVDVDTELDFEFAQMLYKKQQENNTK